MNCELNCFPNAGKVIGIIDKLREVVFPEHFGEPEEPGEDAAAHRKRLLSEIESELTAQVKAAVLTQRDETVQKGAAAYAQSIASSLTDALGTIRQTLQKDAQAGFDGDPAARSVDEVILCYPGFYAVFVHRIAHFLFMENVPFIPRMMSEYAHSITGVDIHPGARIGEHFFIDHGTGVVVGETAVIGDHVKLYQGVTIGALSVKKVQGTGSHKRHPTIEDNVTVYSGASILGGDTVIGKGAVIGGNAFIVKSVPAGMVVKSLNPELQFDDGSGIKSREFTQPNSWYYEI